MVKTDRRFDNLFEHLEKDKADRGLRALLEAFTIASSTMDIDEICTLIVDSAIELCRGDRGIIFLAEPTGGLRIRSSRKAGLKDDPDPSGYSTSLPREVAEKQIPLSLTDIKGENGPEPTDSMRLHNLRSVMCVPLKTPDKLLGVLYIDGSDEAEGHEEANQAFLEALAHLLALALNNVLLYNRALERRQELEKANRDLKALFDVSKSMLSETEPDKLLAMILEKACEVVGTERGSIFLVDKDRNELFDKVSTGTDNLGEIRFSMKKGIAGLSARKGEVIITDDVSKHSSFNPEIDVISGYKTRSAICVPFYDRNNHVFGVMELINKRGKRFTDYDGDLLTAFTSSASKIIENARLLQENLKRQKEVEELNKRLRKTVVDQSMELNRVKEILDTKQTELEEKYRYHSLIGRSAKMQQLYALIDRIKDTPFSVLILGESGTGKELVAKAIHYNSGRKDKPFVAENCAAFSKNLLESELFGHVRGSFTGADRDKKGLFEVADGGTLFLDEIGEMDPELQTKLLRALEEGCVRRVGGTKNIPVDVRIIAATNRDLLKLVDEKQFRQDLYYRLNVIEIRMPSLREKSEDIPLLAEYILDNIRSKTGKDLEIDDEALKILMKYDWPGNVRELENEIKRAAAMTDGRIKAENFSPNMVHQAVSGLAGKGESMLTGEFCLDTALEEVERSIIARALEKADGNKAEAAKILGIPRTSLYNKLKKYEVSIYGQTGE